MPDRTPEDGALRARAGPDPSPLTTQQLLREIFLLREILEQQIANIISRLDQGDKAVALLQAFADRTPTTKDVQHEVTALREVTMEKFGSINTTFSQNDKALTAALQAQEKQAIATNDNTTTATAKMEAGFTKLFDAMALTVDTKFAGMGTQMQDTKDRLTAIESRTQGITQQKTESGVATTQGTSQIGTIAAIVFGGISLLIAIGSAVVAVGSSRPPPQVIYAPPPNSQAK
jgi:hypothetical protein